jgi:putative hydrolase of HD superfamily
MICPSLIERIFSASNIERWNDHPRPIQFTEMAKQAHKMIIAYVIARTEEDRGRAVGWERLIEGSIFELLHRVVLTDIKPPVFHRMMAEQGEKVNRWVLNQLDRDLAGLAGGFPDRFRSYLLDDDYSLEEKALLKGAHYMATQWEFDLVYDLSRPLSGIEKTREEIESQIKEHRNLAAIEEMLLQRGLGGNRNRGIYEFVDLVGQLRFQKRWAQTPRIPQTSVLEHLLFVAILFYLVAVEIGASPSRRVGGFLGGLFHDLPEVLTRDIISPVKNSIEGLDELVKEYERQAMEERIYPLLPAHWQGDLRFFTEEEFDNKVRLASGEQRGRLSFGELERLSREEGALALDGKILKSCDKLAAYIEASFSIRTGITSPALLQGMANTDRAPQRNLTLGAFSFGKLFDAFQISWEEKGQKQ